MCYSASNCLHVFYCCVILSSSFNALWSDRMHGIISIVLHLLRIPLWLKIWSILEKVPWANEKNVYYAELGWNILWTSARSIWPMVWFSFRISLLIFCLDDLSIGYTGVLKSPTTTVLESVYVFSSFRVYLMKLGSLTLSAHRLVIAISFWCISPFISMECPLSHLIYVSLKSPLSEINIATSACFLGPLAW
jgi:hypothetical protein